VPNDFEFKLSIIHKLEDFKQIYFNGHPILPLQAFQDETLNHPVIHYFLAREMTAFFVWHPII
jgi:hypothetical protein